MPEMEKVYCCGDRDNDNVLAAAILANKPNYDPMTLASMLGNGRNGFGNNFSELFLLLLATRMFGGFGGFGDFGGVQGQQNVEMQNQLQAIRTQLQDNQNSGCLLRAIDGNAADIRQLSDALNCDFNTLNACCCDMKQAIADVAGKIGYSKEAVINAVLMGKGDIIAALKDCCCQTQRQISDFRSDVQLQMCNQTNTLRNGQRDLGQAMSEGFSKVGFQQQQDKCEILRAIENSERRLSDQMNSHWKEELAKENQDLKFQLSQERQTRMIERMGRGNWGRDGGNCCVDGCGY